MGRLPRLLLLSGLLLVFYGTALSARAADPYAFNGGLAFEDLQHLVSFGPRPAGSRALEASREWIIGQLKQAGCKVVQDHFVGHTPVGNIPMDNLIAELPGKEPRRIVMLAGHYDTKLEKSFRFVGANDGGSSAAFLIEMARELAHTQHKLTYWLVFFDGEEAMRQQWSGDDNTYGSRHFARKLTSDGELSRIRAMILVDMIAGKHLTIHWDQNSTRWLNKIVFQEADRLGYSRYFLRLHTAIDDDHMPFVNAGVSAVDLLGPVGPVTPDASFGIYWHTAQDTIQHCSPASLTIVGRVVKATLSALENSPSVQ